MSSILADTGIEELVKRVVARGANRSRLVAKIAGGAQMFSFQGGNSEATRVGERNVEATKKKLAQMKIQKPINTNKRIKSISFAL